MNVFARAVPRGRLGRSLLATATVLTMAAGILSVTADAHAESGRRICAYSFKVKPTDSNPNNPRNNNSLVHVSLGMDYKKDGACPGMWDDQVYAFVWQDSTMLDAIKPYLMQLGTVYDYGR